MAIMPTRPSRNKERSRRKGGSGIFENTMAGVRTVMQHCDPTPLECQHDTEQLDAGGAEMKLLFLMDSRRIQKVLWRQLSVLDSMMSLLVGLNSSQELLSQPCPSQQDGGARSRWKSLKADSRERLEETKGLLRALQERTMTIHSKRHKLTQLLEEQHNKTKQRTELADSLKKAQNALRSCDSQLRQLKTEYEATLGQLMDGQRVRDELQATVSAVQGITQIDLLAFSQSELSLGLRPCSTATGDVLSGDLEPVKMSVTWSNDNRYKLQGSGGVLDLMKDCLSGHQSELSAALAEVMEVYISQADLLYEIQLLRSSFAIDWNPAKRLLVYLKSASLVCHLEVEEGYPNRGRALLLSVQRDRQSVDTSELQPPKPDMRLTEWLVFLCSSSLV